MNFLTSLFRNKRSEPSHAAQVSNRAREVKTELERLSSSMYLDDEQYDAVEQQYLCGLNPAECAAKLYPGLLLFEPRHLPDREPTAGSREFLSAPHFSFTSTG